MIHPLKRHGADPKQDATEAIVPMGHAFKVDCSPEEAESFLSDLKIAVEDKNSKPPVPITLPVLNPDGSKGFIEGNFTWKFTSRELFNAEEGTFRMQVGGGHTGWFDVVLNNSTDTYKVKRVKERVFRQR